MDAEKSVQLDISGLADKSIWVRRQVLMMISNAGRGHIGGSLSATDLLVALYSGRMLSYDSGNPEWYERDRFILSKGHAGAGVYAALALAGFLERAH